MTWGRCRTCDRPQPGPLPKGAVARINAARWRPLVVRVLHVGRLEVAPVNDFICGTCSSVFSRKPTYAFKPVSA